MVKSFVDVLKFRYRISAEQIPLIHISISDPPKAVVQIMEEDIKLKKQRSCQGYNGASRALFIRSSRSLVPSKQDTLSAQTESIKSWTNVMEESAIRPFALTN